MPLDEQLYCTQQINVPETLPTILKQFCKAAIRTQPYDLLKWSSTYFRALANGEELPIKLRLEYPPPSTESGLTLGFLKVLLRQFGGITDRSARRIAQYCKNFSNSILDYNKNLSLDTITHRWDGLCLDHKDLELIISIGGFGNKCQVKKFLGIGVSLLSDSLHETMIMICELFTHEPEGGSAMIPLRLFMELYGYLAALQGDGTSNNEFSDMCLSGINKEDIDGNSIEYVKKTDDEDSNYSDTVGLKKLQTRSDVKLKKGKSKTAELQKHTKVPGIGPRSATEQIPSVAKWMNDCAKIQEGMVGPRNLRHFQCPSLDNSELSLKK